MKKKLILTFALIISLGTASTIYNCAISKNTILNKISAQSAPNKKVQPQPKKPQTPTAKTTEATKQSTQISKPINTTPLTIVNSPDKFLNKTVKMQATFDKFSTLGLDYSKALRKSSDYIGILISRDDTTDHNIPLSEMKLFLKKDLAEKHIDLDTGDKIEIVAKEFSTALGDPWLDIESLTIIKKAKKEEEAK